MLLMLQMYELSLMPPVLQGYQGLVDGGDNICPATWESVSMMLQLVSYYLHVNLFDNLICKD